MPRGVGPCQSIRDRDRDAQNLPETHPLARDQRVQLLPGTYSMTMKSMPSTDSISWMVTMFGWFSAEADARLLDEAAAPVLVRHAVGGQGP